MADALGRHSRKVNPGRARSYIARTTPDEVSRVFNVSNIDVDMDQEIKEWQRDFANRMRLKHGHFVYITTYVDSNRVLGPWEHFIHMKAVPGEPKPKIKTPSSFITAYQPPHAEYEGKWLTK